MDNFVSAPYRELIEANSVWVDVEEPIPFEEEKPLPYNCTLCGYKWGEINPGDFERYDICPICS